jgi:hypothetical protein
MTCRQQEQTHCYVLVSHRLLNPNVLAGVQEMTKKRLLEEKSMFYNEKWINSREKITKMT